MNMVDCPVRLEAEKAVELSKDFLKALRRLRRSQAHCKQCVHAGQCPLLASWHTQVETAIREVNAEWGQP